MLFLQLFRKYDTISSLKVKEVKRPEWERMVTGEGSAGRGAERAQGIPEQ